MSYDMRDIAPRAMVLAACIVLATPVQAQGYAVARRFAVSGEGGWDYLAVDTTAHRLYVSRSTHVMVLNTDDGTQVGDITGTAGVHGVAIARDLGRGFTSNGRDSSVTIFDLATLATVGRVAVGGANPDAILYEPGSHRVFTMNARSGTATAIDGASGTVAGMVTLGGRPEFAVADDRGHVFVNLEDSSAVVEFDARTLQVVKHWSILPCEEPSGLALDRVHRRLFSVCGNGQMAVSDADAGRVVATLPIGRGVDGAAFDPATQNAFASCGADGVMTVVHETSPGQFAVIATVPTQRGARTITLDERTHRLYLSTASFGEPAAGQRRPPMIPGSFVVLEVARGGS